MYKGYVVVYGELTMDAWQTFYTTLVATAIGGVIAAYVGYWLAQRSASVSATYHIVKTILSEDFTERRRQIYFTIRSGKSVEDICRAAPSDTDIFMSRSNIIYLLNYYDTLTHCIEDGAMSKDVVRRTV